MKQINRVLLIDDDNIFNFLNKKVIEINNFAIKVSSHVNAKKAIEELKKISAEDKNGFPDIIFLDINMPGMDGWEFLEEFEKLPESILGYCAIYMLTSSIDPSDIKRSKSYRTVKDFISKPLSPEILDTISVFHNQ